MLSISTQILSSEYKLKKRERGFRFHLKYSIYSEQDIIKVTAYYLVSRNRTSTIVPGCRKNAKSVKKVKLFIAKRIYLNLFLASGFIVKKKLLNILCFTIMKVMKNSKNTKRYTKSFVVFTSEIAVLHNLKL